MQTFNNLPVFHMDIDEATGEARLEAVAFVDKPAIQRNFQAFSTRQRFAVQVDRRIVSGPLMLADTPIYRRDEERGEFYTVFTPDAVERCAQRFFADGLHNACNAMHDPDMPLGGLVMFESFIADSRRGIAPMAGFEDVPDGSWFGSYKVNNDALWEAVKDGTFQGFSVEGIFNMTPAISQEEATMRAIVGILSQVEEG